MLSVRDLARPDLTATSFELADGECVAVGGASGSGKTLLLRVDCRTWPISRLSTGERQRLGLVRALVLEPRVLLLDEPTSGLDDAATQEVEKLVRARLDRGASVIWVTHDSAQGRRLARRQLVCTDGVIHEPAP
jgi:phosphate-transporting ATPase